MSIDNNNTLMTDAFQGTYIIRLNVDVWGWGDELSPLGFDVWGIPIWYALDDQGMPTGETIDGNAWGPNTPENMAPPLKEFFQNSGQ